MRFGRLPSEIRQLPQGERDFIWAAFEVEAEDAKASKTKNTQTGAADVRAALIEEKRKSEAKPRR